MKKSHVGLELAGWLWVFVGFLLYFVGAKVIAHDLVVGVAGVIVIAMGVAMIDRALFVERGARAVVEFSAGLLLYLAGAGLTAFIWGCGGWPLDALQNATYIMTIGLVMLFHGLDIVGVFPKKEGK